MWKDWERTKEIEALVEKDIDDVLSTFTQYVNYLDAFNRIIYKEMKKRFPKKLVKKWWKGTLKGQEYADHIEALEDVYLELQIDLQAVYLEQLIVRFLGEKQWLKYQLHSVYKLLTAVLYNTTTELLKLRD